MKQGTRWLSVTNHTRPLPRPLWVRWCEDFWCRLRGLMGAPPLPPDRGLLFVFPQTSRWGTAIHMLGMRFDLTVVWLDEAHRVVDVRLARRWRSVCVPRRAARYVMELPALWYDAFRSGDEVTWS